MSEIMKSYKGIVKSSKKFSSKKEKAHYICTELAEPLAELILEVKEVKRKGGYARTYKGGKWGK